MFRGSARATIDDKGRLKVPTDFRRLLEERWGAEVYMTSVLGDAALIYPLPVWEEIEGRLLAMPSTDRVRERFLERISYYGQQLKLDVQGRLLVPPVLRESAAIAGEVAVLGRLDHLVVWNHERFAKRLEDRPFSEEDFQALAGRGI